MWDDLDADAWMWMALVITLLTMAALYAAGPPAPNCAVTGILEACK